MRIKVKDLKLWDKFIINKRFKSDNRYCRVSKIVNEHIYGWHIEYDLFEVKTNKFLGNYNLGGDIKEVELIK